MFVLYVWIFFRVKHVILSIKYIILVYLYVSFATRLAFHFNGFLFILYQVFLV